MVGIVPVDKMFGRISLMNLQTFTTEALHLGKFWEPLRAVIQRDHVDTNEYNVQFIYRCLNSPDFKNQVPATVNNNDQQTNCYIMQTALFLYVNKKLSFEDVKAGLSSVRVIEMDTAETGLKQSEQLLGKALRNMNKF